MFAIVPIRSGGENFGVVLIEELGASYAIDLNATRRELDLFGAHLGSLLGAKMLPQVLSKREHAEHKVLKHFHGAYYMEPCSWLDSKFTGKMRTEREASWYLGLKWGEDQYVVAYCCVRGNPTERDQFSAEVFRQMLAIIELGKSSGRAKFELADLRSELGGLFSRSGLSSQMDEILFAFSVFDRATSTVSSGHFGGARPVVVSAENRVEAFNQVAVQLRDGRDVRYWEVNANFNDEGLYLLSFDTSKLKSRADEILTNEHTEARKDNISASRRFLETALARNELPRYYLAITRRVEESSDHADRRLAEPA